MKTRNKARLNIVVAVFVAILLTGTAFALISTGPLVFSGTVNVNAELLVGINRHESNSNFHSPGTSAIGLVWHFEDLIPGRTHHYKTVEMHVDFRGDAWAEFEFTLDNLGTVDANVVVDIFERNAVTSDYISIEHDFTSQIIPVGGNTDFKIIVEFDSTNVNSHYFDYTRTFLLVLTYTST